MDKKGIKNKELTEDRISRLGNRINVKEKEKYTWKKGCDETCRTHRVNF